MDVEIIKIEPEKWEEYKELRLASLRNDKCAFLASFEEKVKASDDEWKKRLEESETEEEGFILFARYQGKLVGLLGAYFPKHEKQNHIAELYGFYVDPSLRGKGIGKRLMEEVLAKLEKRKDIVKVKIGVNEIQEKAIEIYKKFGFKEVGRLEKELKIGDEFYDEILLEKFI